MQLFSKPILLAGESESEYLALRAEIAKDMNPRGAINWIIVDDVTMLTWEIFRLRRIIVGIIGNAFLAATQSLLKQALSDPNYLGNLSAEERAIKMALEFFHTKRGKTEVLKIFDRLGLSESAIEAEAYRLQLADLERLDKMLSALERRRMKALRSKQELAPLIRQTTDRIFAECEDGRLEPSTSLEHAD